MQLLDTPGILWPKFEDPRVGLYLAFCGSIRDEIMDLEDLALALIKELLHNYPDMLRERYGLESLSDDPLENMEEIAKRRGFILPGKRGSITNGPRGLYWMNFAPERSEGSLLSERSKRREKRRTAAFFFRKSWHA